MKTSNIFELDYAGVRDFFATVGLPVYQLQHANGVTLKTSDGDVLTFDSYVAADCYQRLTGVAYVIAPHCTKCQGWGRIDTTVNGKPGSIDCPDCR